MFLFSCDGFLGVMDLVSNYNSFFLLSLAAFHNTCNSAIVTLYIEFLFHNQWFFCSACLVSCSTGAGMAQCGLTV